MIRCFLLFSACFFLPNLTADQEIPGFDIGGALRFNYHLSSFKEEQVSRGSDFDYNIFRINAIAPYIEINRNTEYRLNWERFKGGMKT